MKLFLKNLFYISPIILLLTACSVDDEILQGKREDIFSYNTCDECYKDFQNKKIELSKKNKMASK